MRKAFVATLMELAEQDDHVMLLVADVGFGLFDGFASKYPGRFINIGVAEQCMTGVAAGLALSGKRVFTYSLANFPTLRCLEQIRNDVCYHRLPVVIVAGACGLAYGKLGSTHHATEDLAVLRAMPGLTVVAPGDAFETVAATRAVVNAGGPAYLRLGGTGEPAVHERAPDFVLGKVLTVRDGQDATLLATGVALVIAMGAAEQLQQRGINARVLSVPTLKPFDCRGVLEAVAATGVAETIEEHSVIGGLGSAVAECLCESSVQGVVFQRVGIPDRFAGEVGAQDYLRRRFGLDAESVCRKVMSLLERRGGYQEVRWTTE